MRFQFADEWQKRLRPGILILRSDWVRFGPQTLIAALAIVDGLWLLQPYATPLLAAMSHLGEAGSLLRLTDLTLFTPTVSALGLALMAPGLLLRARISWAISLLLLAFIIGFLMLWQHAGLNRVVTLSLVLAALLVLSWRRFDRSSLAASSLFALMGIGSLMTYAVLGALWFGAGFSPPIDNLPTALYFSVETLSTVGFGDIVPHSVEARMFTVSLIIMGLTIFATSLSVVIGPLIGASIKRVMQGRIARMNRRNHFVIIGLSSLAYGIFQLLHARNVPVTVIVPPGRDLPYPDGTDVIVGDATDAEVLRKAGVEFAQAVLTMRDDDAENAFAVLAIKELAPEVRTIAAVNNPRHLEKIRRVQPDVLFAPQVLGSELLVRTLFKESIDNDLIAQLLFPAK